MSDENDTLADYWRDVRPHMKEASRRRRDANRRTGRGKLEAAGVSFVVKNDGGAEEFHAEIDKFYDEKLKALLD